MPPPRTQETFPCLLCDYWFILVALLMILGAAVWRWGNNLPLLPTPLPSPVPLPTATPMPSQTPQPTRTPLPTLPPLPTITPIILSSPTATTTALPEYVLVFVPVDWSESRAQFESDAKAQADVFTTKSNIAKFYDLKIQMVADSLNGVSLSDPDLLDQVIQFGIQRMAADRYIGLTDGDLSPNGDPWITGWSFGPDSPGVIVESMFPEVAAHELGHSFGLCDEYNYTFWKQQNEEFPGGCPNPYPPNCSQELTDSVTCPGNPAADGSNSMMGPSGLQGGYSYNLDSYNHLQVVFKSLSGQNIK